MNDNDSTEETLEQAFEKYIEKAGSDYKRMYGHHFRTFRAGIDWKKKKDESIIKQIIKTSFMAGREHIDVYGFAEDEVKFVNKLDEYVDLALKNYKNQIDI